MKKGKNYRLKRLAVLIRVIVLAVSALLIVIIGYYTAGFFTGKI